MSEGTSFPLFKDKKTEIYLVKGKLSFALTIAQEDQQPNILQIDFATANSLREFLEKEL